jgi:hypothetical protein
MSEAVTELLIGARQAITRPGAWIRVYNHQKDSEGLDYYCTYGALHYEVPGDCCAPEESHDEAFQLLTAEAKALGYQDVIDGTVEGTYGALTNFNEAPETTQEDVLALYDRAIEKSQANG